MTLLPPACKSYRAELDLSVAGEHARTCPECTTWTRALATARRAASLDLPLSQQLSRRLLDIPRLAAQGTGTAETVRPTWPLPQLPLPTALRQRLERIPATAASRRAPFWLSKGRYAVAASMLLASLLLSAFGESADLGRSGETFAAHVARGLDRVQVRNEVERDRVGRVVETATLRYDETRVWIVGLYQETRNRLTELSARVFPRNQQPAPAATAGDAGGDTE